MRRLTRLVFLLILIGMLVSPGVVAAEEEMPILPANYYGSVKDATGQTVTAGTVQAYIDGQNVGELAFTNGFYGSEEGGQTKLVVQGSQGIVGKTVIFKVQVGARSYETQSSPAVTMVIGDVKRVDLTAIETVTAPTTLLVTATEPAANAAAVALDKTIVITFDKNIQMGNSYNNITLTGTQSVSASKSISGNTLTIEPAASLSNGVKYTVNIPAGAVKDSSGAENTLFSFSFTTLAATTTSPVTPAGLNVSGADPAGGAVDVSVNKTVSIFFNSNLQQGGSYSGISLTDDQDSVVDSVKTISGNTLTIDPAADLASKTTYTVTIPSGAVRDYNGNNNHSYSFNFTTVETAATTPPDTTPPDTTPPDTTPPDETPPDTTPPTTPAFSDLSGHWARDIALELAGIGIIQGYPDNTFRPDNNITRIESVAIIVRALELDSTGEQELVSFSDSSDIPAWGRGAAAAAVRANLVKGSSGEAGLAFNPNSLITRAEMAALTARIIDQKTGAALIPEAGFADAGQMPDWARSDINLAAARGIIKGYPDNTFQPAKEVTRAEAASMIKNLLKAISS